MTPTSILSTENLAIGYPNQQKNKIIAEKITVTLQKGELACLLGQNGAGKSTLIRTLSGVQSKIDGRIFIQNQEIQQLKPKDIAKKIGLVLTNAVATPYIKVREILEYSRSPYSNWKGEITEKDEQIIKKALFLTDTTAFEHAKLAELSDGQQQRVLLARVLVQDTPIILLDEPTAHLDFSNRVSLMHLLQKIAIEEQKAILVSTHELDIALKMAQTLWLMHPKKDFRTLTPTQALENNAFEDFFEKDNILIEKNGQWKLK